MTTFDRAVASLPSGRSTVETAIGEAYFVRIRATRTGGGIGTWDSLAPPGTGQGWHTHTRETEIYRIERGTFRFWCGDERFTLGPGAIIALPPHIPHQWENVGAEPGALFGIVVPGGYEQAFVDRRRDAEQTSQSLKALEDRFGLIHGPYGSPSRPPGLAFARAVVSRPEAPRVIHPFGETQVQHITSVETDRAIGLFEAGVAPGAGVHWHTHGREDELFRVISGRFRFWCAEDSFTGGPGATIVAPRGLPHRWENIGDGEGRLLFAVTPGGFEGFFADVAALDAPTPDTVAAIEARYGVTLPPAHA